MEFVQLLGFYLPSIWCHVHVLPKRHQCGQYSPFIIKRTLGIKRIFPCSLWNKRMHLITRVYGILLTKPFLILLYRHFDTNVCHLRLKYMHLDNYSTRRPKFSKIMIWQTNSLGIWVPWTKIFTIQNFCNRTCWKSLYCKPLFFMWRGVVYLHD